MWNFVWLDIFLVRDVHDRITGLEHSGSRHLSQLHDYFSMMQINVLTSVTFAFARKCLNSQAVIVFSSKSDQDQCQPYRRLFY
jgi:hypothetical protein